MARQTIVEYLAPAPTQYRDNVTFTVIWTDVTGAGSTGIDGANLVLLEDATPIGTTYYSVTPLGNGEYEVELNTTYYIEPGTNDLVVELSAGVFYILDMSVTRAFNVRQRITLLSANPVAKVAYNSSIEIILYYQDLYTLDDIGNASGLTSLEILTAGVWLFTCEWQGAFSYYVLTVETYNHPELLVDTPYTLHLNITYANLAPFYGPDDAVISFELRIRVSSLDLDDAPETTPYLDNATFTLYYRDVDGSTGIGGAGITVYNGSTPLSVGTHYMLTAANGYYEIEVTTTSLGGLGVCSLTVHANWTLGFPYHDNATLAVSIRVRERATNVEITVPPSQTRFQDNVVFTFVYIDLDASTLITTLTADDIRLYCDNGTEITSGFTLAPVGFGFEVSLPSTLITSTLVSNYNLTVEVDWDGSMVPYYSDDKTSVKVTVTHRVLQVSLGQILTTPYGDNLTISFILTDEDSGSRVPNAIIVFDCQSPSLPSYWLEEGTGSNEGNYTIIVDTLLLGNIGTYDFDLQIQWDPLTQPYYANVSIITLRGSADEIYTSLQNNPPTPSSVQFSGSLYVMVYFNDLDHGDIGIDGATLTVTYLDTGTVPSGLVVLTAGLPSGQYNISFNTLDLTNTGSKTLNITATLHPYEMRTVTPTFTVSVITTYLEPLEDTIQLSWKASAPITVDLNDLLHVNLTSGAMVTYSWAGGGGTLTEIGLTGRYTGMIDTGLADAGTQVITISASKTLFGASVTTVTLIVLTLPTNMVATEPTNLVQDIDRGATVNITVYLNDTTYDSPVENGNVDEVYATFEGVNYPLAYNDTPGYYVTTIPGSATVLPIDFYSVLLTAKMLNYDPASYQFKVNLIQSETELVFGNSTQESMSAVYSEYVVFGVHLRAPKLNMTIGNAAITWTLSEANLNGTFEHKGDGYFEAVFSTTDAGFGIWAFTFRAKPDDDVLARSIISLTLNIKSIQTETRPVPSPTTSWGWVGNLSFTYWDISFNQSIINATVTYTLGTLSGNAMDLNNGTYLVSVNTTLMLADTSYPLIVTFQKENCITQIVQKVFVLNLVPTNLVLTVPDVNQIDVDNPTELQVPLGDSIQIEFFYNDTDLSDGFVGGLSGANVSLNEIFGPTRALTSFNLNELGNGYYGLIFDTIDSWLFESSTTGEPMASGLENAYVLTIRLTLGNRSEVTVTLRISIIEIPTELELVSVSNELEYGQMGMLTIRYIDTWPGHSGGLITGANITLDENSNTGFVTILQDPYELPDSPGIYALEFMATGPLIGAINGSSFLTISLFADNTQLKSETVRIDVRPAQVHITLTYLFYYGLPSFAAIAILLAAYIKVWSVPKKLRQINRQVKSLSKGKIPKPIDEVKTRQELIADLFNDTFQELELTRSAYQMPAESVEADIPEMGELLIQLSMLTSLTPTELDEFKADISKMRMSEQAAFVKEVIHQESIRVARVESKTPEEVVEEIAAEARRRLADEEVDVVSGIDLGIALTEPVILTPKDEKTEDVITAITREAEEAFVAGAEGMTPSSDRLSDFEINELKKNLEQRGVLPHEIDTILEQARSLPRDLVEELVRSLEDQEE
jgi:hypothetical protein